MNSSSDRVKPPETYLNRRKIIKAAIASGNLLATAGTYCWFNRTSTPMAETAKLDAIATTELTEDQRLASGFLVNEEKTPERSVLT